MDYGSLIKITTDDVKKTYFSNKNKLNHGNISNEIQFNINDQLLLETLLMMIRGNTIKHSSEKKKQRLKEEKH